MNVTQSTQAINPLSLLRKFHQILSSKRSLARSTFNNLKLNQNGCYLLIRALNSAQQRFIT
jgi:hypothetical protein